MKLTRSLLAAALSFSLVFVSSVSFTVQTVSAQDSKIALQRGYRTGYSDGYMAGYRDVIESATRSIDRHREYTKADRAYAKEFGSLEDYRDGYQQGFESGYVTGFDKRNFNAALPADLKIRGAIASNTGDKVIDKTPAKELVREPVKEQVREPIRESNNSNNNNNSSNNNSYNNSPNNSPAPRYDQVTATVNPISNDAIIVIPVETELVIELLSDLNTEQNKAGDRFQARVISPYEVSGAIVEGRIAKIQKPGRVSRRSELQLSFDQIRVSDSRWSNFNALLSEVLPIKGDNVKRVDVEGTVESKGTLKEDIIKVGATTGTGAVIGAVAGGPVGLAVGASVGAAFGVGAVVVERGKHVKLVKGQQLRVKTVYETQIR